MYSLSFSEFFGEFRLLNRLFYNFRRHDYSVHQSHYVFVDKVIAEHGKKAILGYLKEIAQEKIQELHENQEQAIRAMEEKRIFSDTEEKTILKYIESVSLLL